MNKKMYQVFISSTFKDLENERQEIMKALMEMDCIPAGMELFPATDEEQFEFIKTVIDSCDYYLIILGGRYGSLAPDGISYTEKEYQYAKSIGLKIIALIHKKPDEIPKGKSETGSKMQKKLEAFRVELSNGRLVKYWDSSEQLPGLAALSLISAIKRYPSIGWVRGDQTVNDDYIKAIKAQSEGRVIKLLAEITHSDNIDEIIELVKSYNYKKDDVVINKSKRFCLNETVHQLESLAVDRSSIEENDGYYQWLSKQTKVAISNKCKMYALSRMPEQDFFNRHKERIYYKQMLQARVGSEIDDDFETIVQSSYCAHPDFSTVKRIFVTTVDRLNFTDIQMFYITYIQHGFHPYICIDDNKNKYLDYFGEGFLLFDFETDPSKNVLLVDDEYPPHVAGHIYTAPLIIKYFKQYFTEYTNVLEDPINSVEKLRIFLQSRDINVREEAFSKKFIQK
jgi:hypothetical protein